MPEMKHLGEPRPRTINGIVLHIRRSFDETFDVRMSEWALGFILLAWSIVLHLNPTLFDVGPSYSALGDIATQNKWKWFCLMGGGVRILILLINGLLRRSPHLRLLGAFISSFFWFQITLGMIQSGTGGTGLACYPIFLLMELHHIRRCARAARRVDDYLARVPKE